MTPTFAINPSFKNVYCSPHKLRLYVTKPFAFPSIKK